MTPADELRAAAAALRPSSPTAAAHAVTVRLPADVAPALAEWLGWQADAADGAHIAIPGAALQVARALNGEAQR